ncbi:MAG: elongation factor 1-beta [Candidatus Aenigmatarchaeota archaeon]
MGDVAISIKIMPASGEVDIEEVKKKIEEKIDVKDSKIEPLAFGLKALRIMVVKPDTGGGTEEIERQIKEVEGVGDVEVESVTLI